MKESSSRGGRGLTRDAKLGLALIGGTIVATLWIVDNDWHRRAANDRAQAGRGQYK